MSEDKKARDVKPRMHAAAGVTLHRPAPISSEPARTPWSEATLRAIARGAKREQLDADRLTEEIRDDLRELREAYHCGLAVIGGDKSSVDELRARLRNARAVDPQRTDEQLEIPASGVFFELGVAAMLAARTKHEWFELRRGVEYLVRSTRRLARADRAVRRGESFARAMSVDDLLAFDLPRPDGRMPPCLEQIYDRLDDLRAWAEANRPNVVLTHADGITAIVPAQACAGATLVIEGSGFGEPWPGEATFGYSDNPFDPGSGIDVVVTGALPHPRDKQLLLPSVDGCRAFDNVVSWTDTRIELLVQEWMRRGCVGFFDLDALALWRAYIGNLNNAIGLLAAQYKACTHHEVRVPRLTVPQECPPCTGTNRFDGTIPEFLAATADGATDSVIEPGESSVISWSVVNADNVQVFYVPAGIVELYNGPQTSFAVTFTPPANEDDDHEVIILATGPCGQQERAVYVHVRRSTTVTILGVELIQSIQTLTFDQPEFSNEVPLVKGKRTLVRIYVDSGLPSDYNNGGQLGSVLASIRTTQLVPTSIVPFELDPAGPSSAWTTGTGGAARPRDTIDRLERTHSINVELPVSQAKGIRKIEVQISSSDRFAAWSPQTMTVGQFRFRSTFRFKLAVVPIAVGLGPVPTDAEIEDGIDEIRALYPIAWDNGIRRFASPLGSQAMGAFVQEPLNEDDFDEILHELEQVAEEVDDDGQIWCGVLPAATQSSGIDGQSWPGALWWHARAVWIAQTKSLAPHEIMHTLWFIDEELTTEIVGWDCKNNHIKPETTDDLMVHQSSDRWISWGYYRQFRGVE